MKFASREVKEASQRKGVTLQGIRDQNKRKYKETLGFMQEWTEDLLERENELEQQRQEHCMRMLQAEPKSAKEEDGRLNLEKLVNEEFLKKIESLYIKQLMMVNLNDTQKEESIN